jgi:hypothetical protein
MTSKRRLSTDDVDIVPWAKQQAPHIHALAAWYEYARESEVLIKRVKALRRAKMFCSEGRNDEVIRKHCTQHLQIISLLQVRLLVCCKNFPTKPFIRAKLNSDTVPMLDNELFGTDGPVALPWTAYFGLRGIDMSEAYAKWHLRIGRSIHPISIPWQHSNAELTRMFGPIIKRLRPKEFPEPRRAGRKGGGKSLGGLEFLEQLVAYRLSQHGISFDDPNWKKFHKYESKRGYKDAALTAASRIRTLTKTPFFERRK